MLINAKTLFIHFFLFYQHLFRKYCSEGLLLKAIPELSKTWTQILDPDPENPGPRKTWTLKNMDPEKDGTNMGLKNMSDFREFIKAMYNVICSCNSLKNTNDAVFQVNESRYNEFFVVSRSIKKLISVDCANIYFSQSIVNYVFSIFFQ